MSIEHIASEIRKPTTLYKIERWLHTYEEELRRDRSLEDAARFYNVIRIHQSLGYRTPIEVYQKPQMSRQSTISYYPEWVYDRSSRGRRTSNLGRHLR